MPCLQKKDFITNCIIASKSRGLGSFPGPFCMVNGSLVAEAVGCGQVAGDVAKVVGCGDIKDIFAEADGVFAIYPYATRSRSLQT